MDPIFNHSRLFVSKEEESLFESQNLFHEPVGYNPFSELRKSHFLFEDYRMENDSTLIRTFNNLRHDSEEEFNSSSVAEAFTHEVNSQGFLYNADNRIEYSLPPININKEEAESEENKDSVNGSVGSLEEEKEDLEETTMFKNSNKPKVERPGAYTGNHSNSRNKKYNSSFALRRDVVYKNLIRGVASELREEFNKLPISETFSRRTNGCPKFKNRIKEFAQKYLNFREHAPQVYGCKEGEEYFLETLSIFLEDPCYYPSKRAEMKRTKRMITKCRSNFTLSSYKKLFKMR